MHRGIAKPNITLCILCLLIIALISVLPRSAEADAEYNAMTSADSVHVSDNSAINTTGKFNGGVQTDNGGTATIGSGVTIITAGANANGLLVNGQTISDDNHASSITAGDNLSITTSGSNASGINVRDGGTVVIGDNAKISVEYPKTDSTIGTFGVAAWLGDNTTIAFGKSADIRTVGNSVTAVYASGNNSGVTLGAGAVISTAGDDAFGIITGSSVSGTPGATISADNGLKVTTTGKSAIGVYTLGTTKLGDDTTISTSGQNADGLYARGGTTIIGNNLRITTEGKGSHGVEAFVGKADIGNNATITTSGDNASALHATGVYDGNAIPGAIAVGENAKITTLGQSAYGAEARYGGTVTITSADIKTSGQGAHGMYAHGSDSEIAITGGTVTTTGAGAYGLMASDGGKIDVYADINSSGLGAIGANADNNGKIKVIGDITVSSLGSIGASAKNGSEININGDVTAQGDNSTALFATGSTAVINVGGSVSADGKNSYGISANAGSTVKVDGAVLLSGDVTDTAQGTTYSGVYANQSSVTVGGGVVTSGDALKSVMADDGSVVNINGGIKTAGESAMSLYLYRDSEAYVTGGIETIGNKATGIAMHSNNYAFIDGDITVSGGINLKGASLNGGSSADIFGDITVTGGNHLEGLIINNGSKASLDGNIKLTGENNLWGVLALTEGDTSSANITGNIYVSGDSRVQAVRAMSSDVVIEGNITALADNDAFGVVATNDTGMDGGVGSSSVSVSGDIYVSGADSGGVDALYGSRVDVTGNVTVTGDDSFGAVSNMAGSYVAIDGDVTVTGANSTGLYASDDASVYMNGDRLYASGTDSNAMRVEAGGAITLDGVTAGGAATGQTLAYTESGGTINASGSALYGDIINANDELSPRLAVTLDGGSSLRGTVNDTGTYTQFTGTTLSLSDAASTWHVAGDSNFYGLNVNGATVDFRSSPAFTTINLQGLNDSGSLWSTGGHFIMKANIAAKDADLLVVSGVGAAHGTHDITVLNIGNARTDGTEVVTLADTSATSSAEFRLTNVVEQGGWQYTMQTADSSQSAVGPGGGIVYGTLWQLRGNGASNTGDAAINNFIGSYLMNYAETSTLIQRLGDLRETPYASGLWARIHGGKFESNSRSYVRDFDMDYGGIQIGYDRKYEIGWDGDFYAGVMFGYGKGDLDYSSAGSGEVDAKTAGVYATFTSPGGFYVDAVLKYVWMNNDFDTIDSEGRQVSGGEISSGGIGYSVEVGQRIGLSGENKSGWYMEPQVQLSRTRYDGGYFTASNGLHIGTEPFTSVMGRLGLLVGYEAERTNLYAKVSRIREFDGELSIRANGSPISESMEGSWWVYGIGFTSRLSDRNNLYLDIERADGGKFTQPWRLNAGWRMEF